MTGLDGKRILLGVTGGIAACKSTDLVRRLRESGAAVRVVMTPAATRFVTPLTFQALSGEAVRCDLFDPAHEAAMGHIELARWGDVVLVAPASADFIARLRIGMANDLLGTLCLATTAPIILAPAMNQQMWAAAASRENVAELVARGVRFFGPDSGDLACGENGIGRMVEPEGLISRLEGLFARPLFDGVKVTITAGPTREVIDPVRYISNRSSGRMGFALAEEAMASGAQVRLVTGPVALPTPSGVERVDVESAEEMLAAVLQQPGDIFISCAAIADYRVATPTTSKIRKEQERLTLDLVRTPDVLMTVSALDKRPFCVGFAAATDALEADARAKLERKRLDMVAANWVGERACGGGFDSEDNALHVFWADGEIAWPLESKREQARRLIELIAEHYQQSDDKADD